MILERVVVGSLQTNCYILGNENGEVVVIDPGDNADAIMEIVRSHRCVVKYIVLTHGHFDHIGAVSMLKNETGAEILIHEFDANCLTDASKNLSLYVTVSEIQVSADRLLKDGDVIEFGGHRLVVIHTPGHTLGSICLSEEGVLFSGDTLFKESAGRTDLPGGSTQQIAESIEKLMKLDDTTIVYPGHSESSTIKYEREHNPYVKVY